MWMCRRSRVRACVHLNAYVCVDFGTSKALLVDGHSGELIGLADLTEGRSGAPKLTFNVN